MKAYETQALMTQEQRKISFANSEHSLPVWEDSGTLTVAHNARHRKYYADKLNVPSMTAGRLHRWVIKIECACGPFAGFGVVSMDKPSFEANTNDSTCSRPAGFCKGAWVYREDGHVLHPSRPRMKLKELVAGSLLTFTWICAPLYRGMVP